MRRFFALREGENTAYLTDEDARHALTVLRLKENDPVVILMEEAAFEARIIDIKDGVRVNIYASLPSPEPSVRVTLYQGVAKGERMDYAVQKCAEAGVYDIVPVDMSRSVAALSDGKIERLNRIAREAAKQAFRTRVPRVLPPIPFSDLPDRLRGHGLSFVPWEEASGLSIPKVYAGEKDVSIVIGPEGGMSEKEAEELQTAGGKLVTLGPRVFRTETAGLAAICCLMTLSGDMG